MTLIISVVKNNLRGSEMYDNFSYMAYIVYAFRFNNNFIPR